MTLVNRTRLAKRKLEIQEVRKENQTLTSKKHDKRCLENSKNSEKDNLMLQLKDLQNKYDNLEKEQNESMLLIEELKKTIAAMKVETQVEKVQNSIESQTESEFQNFSCQDCVYVASCIDELDWHLENEHNYDKPDESEIPNPYSCNICGKRNNNNGELMSHRKNIHPETIRTCKYFIMGRCDFPESVCWFMHTIGSTTSAPQTLNEYKCGLCDKVFKIKSDFMNHRRRTHKEFVAVCKDNINACCRFDADACWFKHEDTKEIPNVQSTDLITRLFQMMEKFTERMEQMENHLNN